MEGTERSVFIVGIDDSKESFHALEWTLDRFFSPFAPEILPYKLIILHAKPLVPSHVGMAGPGSTGVAEIVHHDLKLACAKVLQQAKEICHSKSVTEYNIEVLEGDARHVLCEAVDKHHASMLIVGSHGYGAIKRLRDNYPNVNYLIPTISNFQIQDLVFKTICNWDYHGIEIQLVHCRFGLGHFWVVSVIIVLIMLTVL